MGARCGRCCIKKAPVVKIQIHKVDTEFETDGEACECGKPFVVCASFCSFCGQGRLKDVQPDVSSDYDDTISIATSTPSSCGQIYLHTIHPGDTRKSTEPFFDSEGPPTVRRHSLSSKSTGAATLSHSGEAISEVDIHSNNNDPPRSRSSSISLEQTGADRSISQLSISRSGSFRSNGTGSASSGGSASSSSANELPSAEETVEVLYQQLAQALKCSGSLDRQSVDVQVMQTPDDIRGAYNFPLQEDGNMPVIRAKVDQTNLLSHIQSGSLRPARLSLQQVSFMSMDWLGVRLVMGSRDQCMQFATCVAALLNISCSKHARSVVVELRGDEQFDVPGFACGPLVSSEKRKPFVEAFIRRMEDISELADIIANEADLSKKKVGALLDKWCKGCRKHLAESEGLELDSKRKFSLNGIFGKLEEQMQSLSPDQGVTKKKSQGAQSSRGSLEVPKRASLEVPKVRKDRPTSPRGEKKSGSHSPRSGSHSPRHNSEHSAEEPRLDRSTTFTISELETTMQPLAEDDEKAATARSSYQQPAAAPRPKIARRYSVG